MWSEGFTDTDHKRDTYRERKRQEQLQTGTKTEDACRQIRSDSQKPARK